MGIGDFRIQYETAGLDRADLHDNPVTQLLKWYAQAEEAGCTEPNAMTVSTVDADGAPDSRIVLARAIDENGITFHTNRRSTKGLQIAGGAPVAAVFGWLQIHRQVRIRGTVSTAPDDVSDAYFASRPRASRIGAWASPQSAPIADRSELDRLIAAAEERFGDGDVPRPPHWGGYVITIDEIEFWQGRPSRLHDRLVFRADPRGGWRLERLAP